MSGTGGAASVPPFAPDYRASGLLLHVTSLPSPYGIGDLGSSAYSWVNRLRDAGQRWWQSLPLGPTGYGNSPYQPMSSFAGNAMLISPGSLILDGLLKATDCDGQLSVRYRRLRNCYPVQEPASGNGVDKLQSRRAQGSAAGLR